MPTLSARCRRSWLHTSCAWFGLAVAACARDDSAAHDAANPTTAAHGGEIAASGHSGGAAQTAGSAPTAAGAGTLPRAGSTGTAGRAGGVGSAGAGASTGGTSFVPTGGSDGGPALPALDCGKQGWAVENHGDPKNRVNYVILADGYTAATVETTLKSHIEAAFKRRFEHESGEPYGRYRKFVNICVMKAISANDGIGNGPTAFDGGNGGDRLAAVNETKVNAYIKANVPATFEVDWKAVVLNQNKWENTGAYLMLWSGAGKDAPGAALHEGGHGFHQLADEYGSQTGCQNQKAGCASSGQVYSEVNSAGDCT